MKFKCEKCATRYTIADEKVRRKVLKIRCKICEHIMIVRDAEPSAPVPPAAQRSPARPRFVEGSTQVTEAPTPPNAVEWYAAPAGDQVGPMPFEELADLVRAGKLTAEDFVWNENFDDWRPSGEVGVATRVRSAASSSPADAAASARAAAPPAAAVVRPKREAVEPAARPLDRPETPASRVAPRMPLAAPEAPARVAPRPSLAAPDAPTTPIAARQPPVDEPVGMLDERDVEDLPDWDGPTDRPGAPRTVQAPPSTPPAARVSEDADTAAWTPARKALVEAPRVGSHIEELVPAPPHTEATAAKPEPRSEPAKVERPEPPRPPPAEESFDLPIDGDVMPMPGGIDQSMELSILAPTPVRLVPPAGGLPVEVTAPPEKKRRGTGLTALMAALLVGGGVGLGVALVPMGSGETVPEAVAAEPVAVAAPATLPATAPATTAAPATEVAAAKDASGAPPSVEEAIAAGGAGGRARAARADEPEKPRPATAPLLKVTGEVKAVRTSAFAGLDQGRSSTGVDPSILDTSAGSDLPDTLSQGEISGVINRNRRSLEGCYQRQLKKDSSMRSARATLKFQIERSGRASSVTIERRYEGTVLQSCLQSVVQRWQFPRFRGEPVAVEFPLIFQGQL